MKLALETSTNVCSVAYCDSGGKMYEKRTEQRGAHSEKLFLFIEELIKEHDFKISDLDEVLISEGPGSYTGLRIGASAIKGLLFQSSITLSAVNTLASFAASAVREDKTLERIHSIIDARRVHVYHQSYSFKDENLYSHDSIEAIPIEEFENLVKQGDGVIGTGLNRIESKILEKCRSFDSNNISAVSLIELSKMDKNREFISRIDPKKFEPKYYSSNQG